MLLDAGLIMGLWWVAAGGVELEKYERGLRWQEYAIILQYMGKQNNNITAFIQHTQQYYTKSTKKQHILA